jgi:hypothetical protein
MINQLAKHIEGLEIQLQSLEVRRSSDKLKKLLSEDFIEYGKSGMKFNLESILSMLLDEDDTEYIMWDFEMLKLSECIVQVRYKTKIREDDGYNHFVFRSSLWRLENEMWKMIFHQGTPMHTSEIENLNGE